MSGQFTFLLDNYKDFLQEIDKSVSYLRGFRDKTR